jgi:hypothetical protein
MELASTTDPKLLDVLAELRQREPIFHRPEFGTTRAELETMVDGDLPGSGRLRPSLHPQVRVGSAREAHGHTRRGASGKRPTSVARNWRPNFTC